MNSPVRLVWLAAGFVSIVGTAAAQTLPPVATEISIGALNNKAQEFVYSPNGTVLSRLDWNTNNTVMLNAQSSMRLLPWLALGLKGSTNLSGPAKMDDFDFDLGGCPASTPGHTECHSNSGTQLRQVLFLDAYASAQFVNHSGITVSALAGFKSDFYRWQAFGGTANYGTLPPGLGISYEQNWSAPYLGLSGTVQSGSWSLNGRIIGSAWAKGDDRDNHHLRSLVFTEDFGRSTFVGADLGVGYRLHQTTTLTLNYSYQNWETAKGPTAIYQGGTQVAFIPGDAAGANNVSHMVSLGVKVDLDRPAAQEGSIKDAPVVRSPIWSGWSVGVTSGFDWQRAHWQTTGLEIPSLPPNLGSANASLNDSGTRGGAFVGYSWRTGSMVWGLEADIGKSNANATHVGVPGFLPASVQSLFSDAAIVSSGWDGSLRARLGTVVLPSLMIYTTGGLALQQVEARLSCPGPSSFLSWCVAPRDESVTKVRAGYTLGGGFESQFAGNWFTRGEYRYTNTGSFDHNFFANAPIDTVSTKIDTSSHQLTFGLGYRF